MPEIDGLAAPRSDLTAHRDESSSQPTPPSPNRQIDRPFAFAVPDPGTPQRGLAPRTQEKLPKPREAKPFIALSSRPAHNRLFGGRAQDNLYRAYNRLRTQILNRLEANKWTTVAITGPTRGTGSTVTAINLAISIARELSGNVLLIELDLIEPSFQKIFGMEHRLGLADHLLHDVPIREILFNPGIDQFDLIPAGSRVVDSSELISSPRMHRFVNEVKESGRYKVVLFDLPSVLGTDDAMAFAPLADCALLVVEEGENSSQRSPPSDRVSRGNRPSRHRAQPIDPYRQ